LPSAHHRTTLVGYIFVTKLCIDSRKRVVKQQYLCELYGPLSAEIGWRVWGIPAYFSGFHVLASLLYRRRSLAVYQPLHDVWRSPGLVHCIYIFWDSYTRTEFCQVQNSLCIQVLHSPILAVLLHGTRTVGISHSGRQPNFKAFSRGRQLYSAGWPLRWALAHILVVLSVFFLFFPCLFSAVTENADLKCAAHSSLKVQDAKM